MVLVLHIDDEAPIRLLSRVNLEAAGLDMIEADDGVTGIELAKRRRPDVVLLGVNLPWERGSEIQLDGFDVAQALREHAETREIPIVFLTARARPEDVARGFELGAVDYITKPFNPLELAPRIRGLLG